MPDERLMGTATRLAASLETLAALAAHLRIEQEGLDIDPRQRVVLRAIATEVCGEAPDVGAAGGPVVGMTQTLLAQALDLVAHPDRPPGWAHAEPALLQGAGRMSMAIAPAIRVAAERLAGLGERLSRPGATLLDVGAGTGWLCIALARTFPAARIIGIDIHEPALALARGNVAAAGLGDRVELRLQDATTLDDSGGYDAIWLAMPFLPKELVPAVLAGAVRSLRPGGWVLPGLYAGPPEHLAELMCDLRTLRSGGHPWRAEELLAELAGAGFAEAHEVRRTWTAPVRLFAGRVGVSVAAGAQRD